MTQLTWDDVIARHDLIGGDGESQEDGMVFRGPLSEIKKEGDLVYFNYSWCARRNPRSGDWEKWHITSSFVNGTDVKPTDIGEGRVFFIMPYLGVCTLFPKGGSTLDPTKVKGLDLSTL